MPSFPLPSLSLQQQQQQHQVENHHLVCNDRDQTLRMMNQVYKRKKESNDNANAFVKKRSSALTSSHRRRINPLIIAKNNKYDSFSSTSFRHISKSWLINMLLLFCCITSLLLLVSPRNSFFSFVEAAVVGTGPNCSDLPAITTPADELFAFGPMESTATANFDFFIASNMTSPQGMQSGYAVRINSGNTISLTQNFWWSGTIGYHDKLVAYLPGKSEILCEWPVRRLFNDTRRGIVKTDLYDDTMPIAFYPNRIAPNTAFDFYLYGTESEDYANLFDTKNYKLDLMFSTHRLCSVVSYTVGDEATATRMNSTTLRWNVGTTSLNEATYSVCLKITNAVGDTSNWFPLSAANGHYLHNLFVTNTMPGPIVFSGLISRNRYGSSFTIIYQKVLTSDFSANGYTVDSSLDVCSPLSAYHFNPTQVGLLNASHVITSITVPQPAQKPGGGLTVTCGSATSTSPWIRLTHNAVEYHQCGVGQFYDGYNDVCGTCDCNNAGTCDTGVTIDYTVADLTCSCFSKFYGANCQFADLPPPNSTLPHLSIVGEATIVNFTALSPDWDVVFFWENGTEASRQSVNYVYLPSLPRHSDPINYTLSVGARSSNGSATLEQNRDTYTFQVFPPTLSQTLTVTKSASLTKTITDSRSETISKTDSATETSTKTLPPTPTETESITKTISATRTIPPTPSETATQSKTVSATRTIPPTPTRSTSLTRTRLPMNATICAANLQENPVVIQFPSTEHTLSIEPDWRCGDCINATSSFGFASSCDGPSELVTNVSFASLFPDPHCNVSFYDSTTGEAVPIELPVQLFPQIPTSSNFWIPAEGATSQKTVLREKDTLSIALLNYSFATVAFSSKHVKSFVRVCDPSEQSLNQSDGSWSEISVVLDSDDLADSVVTLRSGANVKTPVCIEFLVVGHPFQKSNFTVDVTPSSGRPAIASSSRFVKGSAAARLKQVSAGDYSPEVETEDPVRAQVQTSSAFAPDQVASSTSVSSSGLDSITQFNSATLAIVAGSLVGGGLVAYSVYAKLRPKQQDSIADIANAMMSPDQLVAQKTR